MNRSTRILAVAALAVASAVLGMWLAREPVRELPTLERGVAFPTPRALPAFALVDQDGASVGPAQVAGRWTILFFGFTHCPDVCPATLATLAATRRQLEDLPEADRPRVVLVSVDPARDTPELLGQYVAFFDSSFTGLTGEPAEVRRLTEGLGVAVFVGEPDERGDYTVDHTATLFLVNPAGELAAAFGTPHEPDIIARDYRRMVAAGGRG